MTRLGCVFAVVAVVEAFYGIAGVFTPPSLIPTLLGWQLSPDGQWVTKLLGLALASQAAIAWVLRKQPPLAVAWIFAIYQLGAATADWLLWLLLAGDGIFSDPLARVSVIVSIPLHYGIGLLLVLAIRRERRDETERRSEAEPRTDAARRTGTTHA